MELDENLFSPDLPEFHEEAVRHEEDENQYRDVNFNSLLI